MKKLLCIALFSLSSIALADQCPSYASFTQTESGEWHITTLPTPPSGTTWDELTQNPAGQFIHTLVLSEVTIDDGSQPGRVVCAYGIPNNMFLGIDLNFISPSTTVSPVDELHFTPPTSFGRSCMGDPETCAFTVIVK